MIHTHSPRERLMSSMPVCPKPEDQRDPREARVRTSIHPSIQHRLDTRSAAPRQRRALPTTVRTPPAMKRPPCTVSYTRVSQHHHIHRPGRSSPHAEENEMTHHQTRNCHQRESPKHLQPKNEGLGCSKKRETHPEGRSTLITTH